jgi:hypothetical protein
MSTIVITHAAPELQFLPDGKDIDREVDASAASAIGRQVVEKLRMGVDNSSYVIAKQVLPTKLNRSCQRKLSS